MTKGLCLHCHTRKHFVESSGTYLCRKCHQNYANKLREKAGRAKVAGIGFKQLKVERYQEAARERGIELTQDAIRSRMGNGWTDERIINTPQRFKGKATVK